MNRDGGGGIFPSLKRPGSGEAGEGRRHEPSTASSSSGVGWWSSHYVYRRTRDAMTTTTTMLMVRPADFDDPSTLGRGEMAIMIPRSSRPPDDDDEEEEDAAAAGRGNDDDDDDDKEGDLLLLGSAGDAGTKKKTAPKEARPKAAATKEDAADVDHGPTFASAAAAVSNHRRRRNRREVEQVGSNDVWIRKRLRRLDMLQGRFRNCVQHHEWDDACMLGHHYLRTWMRLQRRPRQSTIVRHAGGRTGHGQHGHHGPEDVNKLWHALGEAIVCAYHQHPRRRPIEPEARPPPLQLRFLSESEGVPIEHCYRDLDVLYQLYLDAIEAKQWRDAYLNGTTYWTLVVWFAPQHLDYHQPKYAIHKQRNEERALGILLMLESVAKRCGDCDHDGRGDCGSDDDVKADVVDVATTAPTKCATAASRRESDGATSSASNPNAKIRPTDATNAGVDVDVDDAHVQLQCAALPDGAPMAGRTDVDLPVDHRNDTDAMARGPCRSHDDDAGEHQHEQTEAAAAPESKTVPPTRTARLPPSVDSNETDAERPSSRHDEDEDASELEPESTNRTLVFQDVRQAHENQVNASMGILAKEKSKGAVCPSSDRPASGSGIIAADPTTAARGRRSTNKRVSPSSTVERQGRETRARRSSRHSNCARDTDVQRGASTRDDGAAPTLEGVTAPAARDGVGAELSVEGRHDSVVDTNDFTRPTQRCLDLMREIDAAIARGVCRSEALGILEAAATHFGPLSKGSQGRTVVLCQCCAECRSNPRRAFVTSYPDRAMRSPGSTTTTVFFDDFDNATEIPKNARGELRRHVLDQEFRGVAVQYPPYLEDP